MAAMERADAVAIGRAVSAVIAFNLLVGGLIVAAVTTPGPWQWIAAAAVLVGGLWLVRIAQVTGRVR